MKKNIKVNFQKKGGGVHYYYGTHRREKTYNDHEKYMESGYKR